MAETQANAALCRRIPLSVNSSTQRPVMPDDPETELRSGELPELVFGESVIFCFTFLNPDGTPVSFSGTEVFELSGDSDYDHETGLMIYAGADSMNLPGDWSEADPASGKISLRVNCNTENFAAKLADQESLPLYLEVRMTASDGLTRSVLLRSDATALNTIHQESGVPEEIAAEYYTAAQTEARLNTKAEVEHQHSCGEINDLAEFVDTQISQAEKSLEEQIDGKADIEHNHVQFADYLPLTGGNISGALTVQENPVTALPAGGSAGTIYVGTDREITTLEQAFEYMNTASVGTNKMWHILLDDGEYACPETIVGQIFSIAPVSGVYSTACRITGSVQFIRCVAEFNSIHFGGESNGSAVSYWEFSGGNASISNSVFYNSSVSKAYTLNLTDGSYVTLADVTIYAPGSVRTGTAIACEVELSSTLFASGSLTLINTVNLTRYGIECMLHSTAVLRETSTFDGFTVGIRASNMSFVAVLEAPTFTDVTTPYSPEKDAIGNANSLINA